MCIDAEALLSPVLLLVSSPSVCLTMTRRSEGKDAAELKDDWGSPTRALCHPPENCWTVLIEHLSGTCTVVDALPVIKAATLALF